MNVPVFWTPGRQRAAVEVALLATMGFFFAAIAPFETGSISWPSRTFYWLACIVGGGIFGIAISALTPQSLNSSWLSVLVTAILMTPAVTLLVMMTGAALAGHASGLDRYLSLMWQVFLITLPVTAVRALVWRRKEVVVQTRTIFEPPLPGSEMAFRRRLSAKRRFSRLIAVEAHDHYLRVHTEAGSELIAMRFSDALVELAAAHGYRVHRSWWVAGNAIEAVQWRRGVGQVQLYGQLVAPVSRRHADTLRIAGWI